MTKDDVIRLLDLKPLPEEGGFYRETYRSTGRFTAPQGERVYSTAIYYLVTEDDFSALHRVKSDEIFHFYAGDPVEMFQIDPSGVGKKITLGSNLLAKHSLQVVVPAGVWQGTRIVPGGGWALLGTTVAPGFEFQDFEVDTRINLMNRFPDLKEDIRRFTREA